MQVLTTNPMRPWIWGGSALAVIALLAWSHWSAYDLGRTVADGEHAHQTLQDAQAADEARRESQRIAQRAAAQFEGQRQAIRRELSATKGALDAALNRKTTSCPQTVGDAVVPGDLWLRLQAIDDAGAPGPTRPVPDR